MSALKLNAGEDPSPFEFGRVLGDGELADRTEELADLMTTIRSGAKQFLIGPRRHGKSSLLLAAAARAEREGVVVLRYDAESFPEMGMLLDRLVSESARKLTPTMERAAKAVTTAFARLRPQLSIDPQSGEMSAILTIASATEAVPLLVEALDVIEKMAKEAGRRVVVMIDEFQRIIEDGGERAEAQIRAAVQYHQHVAYIFAGSNTRMLRDMTSDPRRPFYKLGDVRSLGPIPRDEYSAYLQRQFEASGITVEAGAIEAILDTARDVPYNVQLLAHGCWEACRVAIGRPGGTTVPTPLTVTIVEQATRTAAQRADPYYTQLWTSLTSVQQRALLAFIREDGQGLSSTAVAARYNMPVPTMSKSLKLLENKGILREDFERGSKQLRLEDPLFEVWIANVIQR